MKAASLFPLLAGAVLAAGCATTIKAPALSGTTGGWYSVAANQTPFYRYGPQQGSGPDTQLSRDSIMKVIRPSFGYVKVQLQDGESGYVASEDIRPASTALVAEKLAPPPTPAPVFAAQTGEDFQLNSDDPRLIAPPEPLPEATPAPDFRF
ncbi:MAG: hypothetical protein ABI787_11030 [Spartobacteria bacterium]